MTWDTATRGHVATRVMARLTLLREANRIVACLFVIWNPEAPQWQAANDG